MAGDKLPPIGHLDLWLTAPPWAYHPRYPTRPATLSDLRAVLAALSPEERDRLGVFLDEPDGWIRREALDHWKQRAEQAERERDDVRANNRVLTRIVDVLQAKCERLEAEAAAAEKQLHRTGATRGSLTDRAEGAADSYDHLISENADLEARVQALEAVREAARQALILVALSGAVDPKVAVMPEFKALGDVLGAMHDLPPSAPQPEKAEPSRTICVHGKPDNWLCESCAEASEQPDIVDDLVHRVSILPGADRYRAMSNIIESALMDFVQNEINAAFKRGLRRCR